VQCSAVQCCAVGQVVAWKCIIVLEKVHLYYKGSTIEMPVKQVVKTPKAGLTTAGCLFILGNSFLLVHPYFVCPEVTGRVPRALPGQGGHSR
jgi:hypothetical protein